MNLFEWRSASLSEHDKEIDIPKQNEELMARNEVRIFGSISYFI